MQTNGFAANSPTCERTEFKDEIMGGAKKVAMGAVIIGGLVIFDPDDSGYACTKREEP